MAIFKLRNIGCVTYVLDPGFTKEEIGPYGVNRHLYEELGQNMITFSVTMGPFYDTESDPRLRTPEKRKEIEERLMNHPQYGLGFTKWDPDEEKVETTIGDQKKLVAENEELKRVIQRMRKGGAKAANL